MRAVINGNRGKNLRAGVRLLSSSVAFGASLLAYGPTNAAAEKQDITQSGVITRLNLPTVAPQGQAIDYATARAMPLPKSPDAPPSQLDALRSPAAPLGKPSMSPGAVGSGKQTPVVLVPAKPEPEASGGAAPEAFGSSNHPFTTSRVNVVGNTTSSFYPYRAAGKLFFQTGSGTSVCTASLIRKGLAVTAAHCVALYGSGRLYTGFQFVPAYNNGTAPL